MGEYQRSMEEVWEQQAGGQKSSRQRQEAGRRRAVSAKGLGKEIGQGTSTPKEDTDRQE